MIGVIVGERLASESLRDGSSRSPADSLDVLCSHIDKIREITGSFENIAIGSDLGGSIKPLRGLEDAGRLGTLVEALEARYGQADARLVLGGSMLSLLRTHWSQRQRYGAPEEPSSPAGCASIYARRRSPPSIRGNSGAPRRVL